MADYLVTTFAKMGEITSLLTLISPLPSFMFCHKPNHEKIHMLNGISYSYLISLYVMNATWVAYCIKEGLDDIIVINLLGMLSALIFILIYIYTKYQDELPVYDIVVFISTLPFTVFVYTDVFSSDFTGFLAVLLSIFSYVTTLGNVTETI